jgi:pimeloyl-ACP methyl ester carboxylesterase
MIAVMRALSSEVLKLKRTLAVALVLVAPALAALLAMLAQTTAVINGRGDAGTFWEGHTHISLTMWALFVLPVLIALETTLLCSIEHGERQWKHIFALPIPRHAIYVAKFAVAQALILLSTLVLWVLILLSGKLLMIWHPALASAGAPPIGAVLLQAINCWVAAGLILSINLWIALRWPSFTVPLGVGIAGTFVALFATSARAATYYPWLLPLNVLSGSQRLMVALILGGGGGLVVAALGGVDFCRREESASPRLGRPAVVALMAIVAGFVCVGAYLDWGWLSNQREPATRFVEVEKNVRLEVLDWGGSGRPVVLLAGLGDTAHVFDGFAAKLTSDYHVLGITRRGFGGSSHPASGYDAGRLGDDVVAVIRSLRLRRPVLVGHSIGGEELSSVGLRYPESVSGLVYLDAAYPYAYYDPARGDLTIDLFALEDKLEKLKPGSGIRDPRPLMQDVIASLPGFERVLRRRLGDIDSIPAFRSSSERLDDGRPARPGVAAAKAIVAGEQKFGPSHVPILAIYAMPHDWGPRNNTPEAEARDIASLTGPQAKAFETAVHSARVIRLPHASHNVFLSNESDVLREMKAFIDRLPQ